jgi:hypothetical protein
MTKPRRKSEIRAAAQRHNAILRDAADIRAAFLKPRPKSWHDVFLAALDSGKPAAAAAREAGISKAGAYHARQHEPGFAAAWDAARAAALARRIATLRTSNPGGWKARIDRIRSTTFQPNSTRYEDIRIVSPSSRKTGLFSPAQPKGETERSPPL